MNGYGKQKKNDEDKFAVPPTYVVHGKAKIEKGGSSSSSSIVKGNSNASVGHVSRKLDAEDGDVPQIKQVSHDVKMTIQNGRKAKGWTQKELAQRMTLGTRSCVALLEPIRTGIRVWFCCIVEVVNDSLVPILWYTNEIHSAIT